MTSFDADLDRLATQLATMAAAPATTTAANDTATVNLARRTLRNCGRVMLTDLAPPARDDTDSPPRLADLALDPIGVLRTLLQPDPPALTLEPHGRDTANLLETGNAQWKRLADAAEIVTHEWTSADPSSRPTGEPAWTRIADTAALIEAAATLDRQLLNADAAPSTVLKECVETGLAADHVRRYATSGPLPQPEPLRPPPQRLRPAVVRGFASVPAGFAHLAALVTAAGHLRPDMIRALVAAHIRNLDTLASALTTTSPPAHRSGRRQFATALRNHGKDLTTVRIACRSLKSVDPDDPRPAAQMREIRAALQPVADTPDVASRDDNQRALLAALRPALTVSLAIDTAARSYIRSGRWYMPTEDQDTGWSTVSHDHPINVALKVAASDARTLISHLPPPHPGRSPYRTPHEILAPAVLQPRTQRSTDGIAAPAL